MREYLKKINLKPHEGVVPRGKLAREIKLSSEVPMKFTLEGYNFPIVSGLVGSREMISIALGITKNEIIPFISKKIDHLEKYKRISDAPFLANKIDADININVEQYLPLIDFYAGKKYTTSSIVIVQYPGENRLNASFHRMMYLGGNKFAIRIVAQRHLNKTYIDAMEKGNDLKVAIVFGVHPAIEIAASFSAPKIDELELAAAFLGGLKVFALNNGISVPANAEFVIEGRITKEMAEEGPFIDVTQTADRIRQQPVLEVDCLYFRDAPIFRTILPGGNEHRMLMGVPQEPRIYKEISKSVNTVKNVILTPGGNCWLHGIVQIKKRTDDDAKNAILAAFAAHPSLKRIIIVDEDININDPFDVEWAIATRVQPDKDFILIPNSKGSSLDPSSKNSITCKWGIDATKPLEDNEGYNKVEF